MTSDQTKNKDREIALFCTNFLEYSQTFVYQELSNLSRYKAEVFCWRRHHEERFPYAPVHVANRGYVATGQSPLFHRQFKKKKFALAYAHFGLGGAYALPYSRKYKLPLVVMFHGYDVPLLRSYERFHPMYWHYTLHGKRLLREMTLGLCASNELKEILMSAGVEEERLRVHRLGIDLDFWSPDDSKKIHDEVRILMVGRFVEKKGFEYGLRAFANLKRQTQTKAMLTLIGDGPLRKNLEQCCSQLGVQDSVKFLGSVCPNEVAMALKQTDVLLAPSVVDAHGDRESGLIVAKEASACEVPVIGTYHGGIHEIIDDGHTGFLVPERQVDALTSRLVQLAESKDLRQRMGQSARKKMIAEYDIKHRTKILEDVFDSVR